MYRLVKAIENYDLEIFVNNDLIGELERNLPKIIRVKDIKPYDILDQINLFTSHINTTPSFKNCPDPKDNFLFDIALQSECEAIVTQEKILLNYLESPIPVRSIVWFKQTFEVPL
jgi:putative PIN family toxin of toxin-antitoxin system